MKHRACDSVHGYARAVNLAVGETLLHTAPWVKGVHGPLANFVNAPESVEPELSLETVPPCPLQPSRSLVRGNTGLEASCPDFGPHPDLRVSQSQGLLRLRPDRALKPAGEFRQPNATKVTFVTTWRAGQRLAWLQARGRF